MSSQPRPTDPVVASGRSAILRALRHRNYRLFFGGQSVSLIGTWVSRLATSWLVYRLSGSAAVLGLVGFVSLVPAFLLSPFAGVWVDRWNRYRTLLWTQVASMVQSFALAALALSGVVQIWHLLVLGAVQGAVNAIDVPARQAFLVQMIEDREDLPNAIALNSSMFNGARLVGPALAGLIVAAVGEGWCFFADGVSYLAVIGSLIAMNVPPQQVREGATRLLEDLRAGVRYAFGFAPIRAILLLLGIVSLFGMPYSVLMPVIADRTLHGGPHTLGFLMGASGVGALAGALYLAARGSVVGLGRVILASTALFGVGLVGFGLARTLPLALLLMVATGWGFMVQMAASNTIVQTLVREDMRGRVMAFYTMSVMGTAPFGSLAAGAVAAKLGAGYTIAAGGGVCLLAAAFFARMLPALRSEVRPIYVARGIIPEITAGISEAGALRTEVER